MLDAAIRLFLAKPYDEVSLQSVADAAGVSLKTVVRKFGSKDALLVQCARAHAPAEQAARPIVDGDVASVASVLAGRYEALSGVWQRFMALEDRFAAVAEVTALARAEHHRWLASVFSRVLALRPDLREQRLAELFGATEIYVWNAWRRHLGLSRKAATHAMTDMLRALIDRWEREGGSR